MALVSGPERCVCVPGLREIPPSRDWANVRVTKGMRVSCVEQRFGLEGRYGAMRA